MLTELRARDPRGGPELQLLAETGVEVHWRSGLDGNLRRVLQVESVAEAVCAYVHAGIMKEADAVDEQRRLEQQLASN